MENRTIQAEGLVKTYGDGFRAVDGVSFKVASGEIYGFLGPNGAGKSTTVSMLTTLAMPTDGSATVGGHDVVHKAGAVRAVAGVALQEIGVDPLMTGRELLRLQSHLFGMNRRAARARADELLEIVRLTDAADKPCGQYSGGMRRRLDLALALVHKPFILFLDEPTTGLDPASRRDVWTEVRRLNRERGMTVFLTTQYLEEADQLADRVAIINAGQIAVEGTPRALKGEMGGESITMAFDSNDAATHAGQLVHETVERIQTEGTTLRLYLPGAASALPGLIDTLGQAELRPSALTIAEPTLDDVFLKVTGEAFTEAPAA